MPAQKDLTGQRFGRLTVIRKEGRVTYGGRLQAAWRVRCDCGREEVYPQNRLPHTPSLARQRGTVTACTQCSRPPCVVCGELVPVGSRRNTCSDECHREKLRERSLAHYRKRVSADPEYNKRRAALIRYRKLVDPEYRDRIRETARRTRERLNADPERAEKRRAAMRAWYAKNAERVQAKRRERLAKMSPEELARWMDRQRAYQRAYARRWREDLKRNPERHQKYLDYQREYRRQQQLQALRAVSAELEKRLNEHGTDDQQP